MTFRDAVNKTLDEALETDPAGFLVKILAKEGEAVPIADVIGLLADSLDEMSNKKSIKASPIAQTLAKEHAIDLSKIQGTGPDGRIQKSDVLRNVQNKEGAGDASQPKEKTPKIRPIKRKIKITPIRSIIAQKTLESKSTIPHFYLFSSVDVTNMLMKRKEIEQSKGLKISIDAIMIKATAASAIKFPLLNASWNGDEIWLYEQLRIGFAVDTEEGIMIPHLSDPQKQSVGELEILVQRLVEETRQSRVSPQDLEYGCLSISNLGIYCIDEFIPIIYPGEVGMLGVGRAQKTARWIANRFVPRDTLKVVLSLDHRVVDGSYGARFLQDLQQAFEGDGLQDILR